MDMHTGSTDEYETDEHHFDNDGDSSEDELFVANHHVSLGSTNNTSTNKKKRAAPPPNDKHEGSDSYDDNGLLSKKKKPSKAEYDDSSSSDEEEVTTNNDNKRGGGRRALGRMNDNNTNTRNNNNDSSDDDNDSDDDSDDLGLGLGSNKQSRAATDRKRAALMQMYSSSSSDDDSDNNTEDGSLSDKKRKVGSGGASKRPPAMSAAAAAALKPPNKKVYSLDDSSDSDDSGSDCVDVTPRSRRTRSTAPVAAAASAKASRAAIDCMSSDSDEDLQPTKTTTTTPSSTPSKLKSTFKSFLGKVGSLVGVPPSDNTTNSSTAKNHDPSVRANSNATLEAAKRARAALLQSQGYHAEDVNLPSLPSQVVPPPRASPAGCGGGGGDVLDLTLNDTSRAVATAPAASYTGPIITIYLRYRDSNNKESKVGLKIKMDQPLQHLVDQFQQGKITQMKFDGQNVNLTKTPSFYDMDDEDLIDVDVVVVGTGNQKVVIHVRGTTAGTRNETYEMKKTDPLKKMVDDYCKKNQLSTVSLEYNGRKLDVSQSCAQLNIVNNAHLDAIVASGPSINLIFRVNGKANETERMSIRMKETFQHVFDTFVQRRGVNLSQCEFVFDGETLRPSATPEHLDLEGDEIIDVKVAETSKPVAPPPRVVAKQSTASRLAGSTSSASTTPVMITIETNRNQNNNPRQKKWKLLDTSAITKLKTDYTKYYKSKGCKQVKFYFRNQLITDESQTLRACGIGNGDLIYAMENGKSYNSM